MTQPDVASTIGVHRNAVSRWESGVVRPSPAHLTALEHVLGVRFVNGSGSWRVLDPDPDPEPDPLVEAPPAAQPPMVVILNNPDAAAIHAVFDRLGVPRQE